MKVTTSTRKSVPKNADFENDQTAQGHVASYSATCAVFSRTVLLRWSNLGPRIGYQCPPQGVSAVESLSQRTFPKHFKFKDMICFINCLINCLIKSITCSNASNRKDQISTKTKVRAARREALAGDFIRLLSRARNPAALMSEPQGLNKGNDAPQ